MYICSSPNHEDQLSSLLPLPFPFPFSFNSWLIHLVSRYILHTGVYISPSPIHNNPQSSIYQNLVTSQAQTMPRKGCKRVGFSSDINERPPVSLRSILDPKPTNSRLRSHRQMPARSSGSPPVRLFRYVRVNVTKALGLLRKRRPTAKCSSNMVAPQCFVPPRDSLHSETLEDCIEFINSSYRKSI